MDRHRMDRHRMDRHRMDRHRTDPRRLSPPSPARASRIVPGALLRGDVEVVLLAALRVPVPLPGHAVELERAAIRALRDGRAVAIRRPRLAAHVSRRSAKRSPRRRPLDGGHLSLDGLDERRERDEE